MQKALYSSNKQDWGTPQWLFDALNKEFNFTVDVCATENNTKCANYYTPEINGLTQNWEGVCWLNPPYKHIAKWLEKAHTSTAFTVALIPARTDTRYWWDYCIPNQIRFIKGRLKFEANDLNYAAPFPSAIIIFDGSASVKWIDYNKLYNK